MRPPSHEWQELARRLPYADIAPLIRSLTIAERDLANFNCGSVSPVISLYRFLLDSSNDDFTEIRDWILAHTRNPYLHSGSTRYQPASLPEYIHLTAEHEARRRAREQADEEGTGILA